MNFILKEIDSTTYRLESHYGSKDESEVIHGSGVDTALVNALRRVIHRAQILLMQLGYTEEQS